MLVQGSCFGCSSFVLKDSTMTLLCTNFDFYTSKGIMLVNKAGVGKRALVMPPAAPAEWNARFGSVTFNQIGAEFPFGGMNEKGLSVALMWLEKTRYPAPDNRPGLHVAQWIQYQLDNFESVEAVLDHCHEVRITESGIKLHFLLCDRFGESAVIEFIDGELVSYNGASLPVAVLTNDSYQSCCAFLKDYAAMSFEEQIAHTTLAHKDRFVKIARRVEEYASTEIKPGIEYAFDVLASVSAGKIRGQCTVWSIVYDISHRTIYFKTYENRKMRFLQLEKIDFSRSASLQVFEITADMNGSIAGCGSDFTAELNSALVVEVFTIYRKFGFLGDFPPIYIHLIANYPSTLNY